MDMATADQPLGPEQTCAVAKVSAPLDESDAPVAPGTVADEAPDSASEETSSLPAAPATVSTALVPSTVPVVKGLRIDVSDDMLQRHAPPALCSAASSHTASSISPPLSSGCTPGTTWKKHIWKESEDALLQQLVDESLRVTGKVRWASIGAHVEGRSGKQCRERWHNHLSPDVSKSEWTAEEDAAIVSKVHELGTRWSEIVKSFPRPH